MRLRTKFQDEDFELGEVVDASIMYGYDDKIEVCCTEKMKHRKYNSIKDFTDHWEDAPEEPKEYWTVDCGMAIKYTWFGLEHDRAAEAVGLKFDTEEECKRAIEKLKAFKRLKDKGMIKYSFIKEKRGIDLDFYTLTILAPRDEDSLKLLFGGEE